MSSGNGHLRPPLEVLDAQFQDVIDLPPLPPIPQRRPALARADFILADPGFDPGGGRRIRAFLRAQRCSPFPATKIRLTMMLRRLQHPRLLLLGIPFSLTLLGILLAHELGHYFTCKYYGIDVELSVFHSGAHACSERSARFLRIRSPITTRRALFDIGIAGPIAGFVVAVPLMAYAIATSKIVPGAKRTPESFLAIRR